LFRLSVGISVEVEALKIMCFINRFAFIACSVMTPSLSFLDTGEVDWQSIFSLSMRVAVNCLIESVICCHTVCIFVVVKSYKCIDLSSALWKYCSTGALLEDQLKHLLHWRRLC